MALSFSASAALHPHRKQAGRLMGSASSDVDPLHIVFFPLMCPGDFLPMIDMARTFSSRGGGAAILSTVVTTPSNAAPIRHIAAPNLSILTIPFPPPTDTGLVPGVENFSGLPASQFFPFVDSLHLLRPALESLLAALTPAPTCIVSDALFPWTADLGIPRIVFHAAGAFPIYVTSNLFKHFPFNTESFLVDGPDGSGGIRVHARGLPDLFAHVPFLTAMARGEANSYGVVLNTYREMEPPYVDSFKKANEKAWCVGPLSLCCRNRNRGGGAEVEERVMGWLDSKGEGSVVYVCFGSLCRFNAAQLREIALGLEGSGASFVWVVREQAEGDAVGEGEWMPEGYEGRVGGRGLVVRGWAPQREVLGHGAVGWFVTHCGWNSVQEACCAGVPVVAWPLSHEQFINAELVVEVMGVGVRMWEGFRRSDFREEGGVVATAEEIAGVVRKVMGGGEEVEGMTRRAREYGAAARRAVEEGGSSYEDIGNLIEDLQALKAQKQQQTIE